MRRNISILLVLVMATLVTESHGLSLTPGQRAPSFTLKDTANVSHSLADFKGKVVVMQFWSSSCGPCLMELPTTSSWVSTYGPQGAVILAVDFEKWSVQLPTVRKYRQLFLQDPDSAAFKAYGVVPIPHNVVISRNGIIAYSDIGWVEEYITASIEQCLRAVVPVAKPENQPAAAARLQQIQKNKVFFTLANQGRVRLTLHDGRGRLVAALVDGPMHAGS